MTVKHFHLLLLFIIPLFTVSSVQADNEQERQFRDLLKAYHDMGTFSGNVLLARDDQVTFNEVTGKASYELDIAHSGSGKFRIGPVSKVFTSVLVMQLVEENEIALDDPINKYIDNFPAGGQITIEHLLQHSSGIPDFEKFNDYPDFQKLQTTPPELINRFLDLGIEFEPGSRFQQSASDYVVLGHILESVTQKKYEEMIREKITNPLEMHNTGYDREDSLIPGRVSGYKIENGRLRTATHIDMSVPHAGGGLFSTTEDLHKFFLGLINEQLITKENLQNLWEARKSEFGLGWMTDQKNGHKRTGHSGTINGFSATFSFLPDEKTMVAILSNIENAPTGEMADNFLSIMLEEDFSMPESTEQIELNAPDELYTGTYQINSSRTLTIIKEGDTYFAQVSGQPEFEIYPVAEDRFLYTITDASIDFEFDDQKQVSKVFLRHGGEKLIGTPSR